METEPTPHAALATPLPLASPSSLHLGDYPPLDAKPKKSVLEERYPGCPARTAPASVWRCLPTLLLALCGTPALAQTHVASNYLFEYLTYGISPSDGPRGYAINVGRLPFPVSACLVYQGDYTLGAWGYWHVGELGGQPRYDAVQSGLMGGLTAKLSPPDSVFNPTGMTGIAIQAGANPERRVYLSLPGSMFEAGLATIWVVHGWNDPSPWGTQPPPGGSGWGGYTAQPRFYGYWSTLVVEYMDGPPPLNRGSGNGDFQTGTLDGWTAFAPNTGSVQVVTFPTDSANYAARLTSRQEVVLTQLTIEGVDLGFLEFDYLFLTNSGRLAVSLGGQVLCSLQAPSPAANTLQHVRLTVPTALNQAAQPLTFDLVGLAGEQMLLDNVGWLPALRILQTGPRQTVNNQECLPLEFQGLTNELYYVQAAPAVTGRWQAVVAPFPTTSDPARTLVPLIEGWPQAFYRIGLWEELRLLAAPENATAYAGVNSSALSATAAGCGPFTYQWRRQGTNLVGQTGATLALPNPQPADAGDYTVVVTDVAGASITNAAPATLSVRPFPAPVGWWPGDGHAFDLTTNHNDGALQGGAGYAAGQVGPAFSFDGVNDYVAVPDSPALQLPDAPFSIALWFQRENTTSGQVLLSKGASDSDEEYSIDVEPDGLIYWDYGGMHAYASSTPTNLPAGEWHHLVVTYSPTASPRGSIYLNGSQMPLSAWGPDAHIVSSGSALYFGQQNNGSMYYNGRVPFKGQLDEVAIFNSLLSSDEIAALHAAGGAGLFKELKLLAAPQNATAYVGLSNAPLSVIVAGSGPFAYQWRKNGANLLGQTGASLTLPSPQFADAGDYTVVVTDVVGASLTGIPPARLTVKLCEEPPDGLVAWWSGDGHTFDHTANHNDGTLRGGAGFTNGFVGQAFSFDGAGAYLEAGTNEVFDFDSGNGDLTIEAWINLATLPPSSAGIVSKDAEGPYSGWAFYCYSDGRLGFGGAGVWEFTTAPGVLRAGVWFHIAAVKNGSSYSLYCDGGLVASTSHAGALETSAAPLRLGTSLTWWMSGLLDEVGIYTNALSPAQIASHYAAGSAGMCKELKIVVPPSKDAVAYLGVSNAPFSVLASGTRTLRYQWSRGATPLAGQTNATLVLPNPQLADAGDYTVVVTDATGASVTSAVAATLTVKLCEPPPAGLGAWWSGDGTFDDLMGTNHGSAGAGVKFVSGKIGGAFRFVDSPDSFIQLPNAPVFQPTNNQFTIAAWVKPDFSDAGSSYDSILTKRDGCDNPYSYAFAVTKGFPGYPMGAFGLGMMPQIPFIYSTNRIPDDGRFHHIAATYNGDKASGNCVLYLDGQIVGGGDGPGPIPVTSASPIVGKAAGCPYYSRMDLDELCFFDRELSPAEIRAIHAAGSAGMCRPGR